MLGRLEEMYLITGKLMMVSLFVFVTVLLMLLTVSVAFAMFNEIKRRARSGSRGRKVKIDRR